MKFTIIGGGPAGLACGYFAKKKGVAFHLFEAKNVIGGNAVTLKHGPWLFDSGAHRFHNKDPEITRELKMILGNALMKVSAPSQIYHEGLYIDFPLAPYNLVQQLGTYTFFKAAAQVMKGRLSKKEEAQENFETFATRAYGREIAGRFLLDYSEKLWGAPCRTLSPKIAGKRMKGLTLKTFLIESFLGKKMRRNHLEGSTFYYPQEGFGAIADKLAELSGKENLSTGCCITKIIHDKGRIQAVEVNHQEVYPVDTLINTLPLPLFIKLLSPALPTDVIEKAESLSYRNLVLVFLALNKKSVSPNASLYFPDKKLPFTRIYEPRNRSTLMAPKGTTSLVVEIPCSPEDPCWVEDPQALIQETSLQLQTLGLINPTELLESTTHKISHAYPILKVGSDETVKELMEALSGFSNLSHTGRGSLFAYTHTHDMLRQGKDIIETLTS